MTTPSLMLQPSCLPEVPGSLFPSLYLTAILTCKAFHLPFLYVNITPILQDNLGVPALIPQSVTHYSLLILSHLFPCTILCAVMDK